jgi:hypothetical protein
MKRETAVVIALVVLGPFFVMGMLVIAASLVGGK